MQALSFPTEYSITGFSAFATTSRMIWMLSASSLCKCVSLPGVIVSSEMVVSDVVMIMTS